MRNIYSTAKLKVNDFTWPSCWRRMLLFSFSFFLISQILWARSVFEMKFEENGVTVYNPATFVFEENQLDFTAPEFIDDGEACGQTTPSNDFETSLGSFVNYNIANDFVVDINNGDVFALETLTFNAYVEPGHSFGAINLRFYNHSEATGGPGTELHTFMNLVPSNTQVIGEGEASDGTPRDVVEVTVNFDEPINFLGETEETIYWAGLQLTQYTGTASKASMELTSQQDTPVGTYVYLSGNWNSVIGLFGVVRDGVMSFSGTCSSFAGCANADAGEIMEDFTICPNVAFTLETTDASEPADGLQGQWMQSPAGQNDWQAIEGATSTAYTVEGGITESMDYKFTITCDVDDTTDETSPVSVTLNSNVNECYCTPEGTNVSRYISNFSTADGSENISNMDSGFSDGGYGDFYDTMGVTQIRGVSVSFTATTMGGTAGFRAWVDWNQDGIFDATEEVAYQSTGYSSTHTGLIEVPTNAELGDTRMRVVSHWLSSSGSVDPCATGFSYGEFEDYRFTVEPMEDCDGTPNGGTITIDPETGNINTTYTVSASGYSIGNGMSYQWQSNTAGAGWVDEGEASDVYSDYTATAPGEVDVTVEWRLEVTCTNSDETAYSDTGSFTTALVYCTPSFSSNLGDHIDGFELENISNLGSGRSEGGYGDFTDMSTDLNADQAYTASLTSANGSGTHAAAVWIDFNNDGTFDVSEKVGYTNGIGASQTVDIALTIPADALAGEHRMRVLYQFNVTGENLDPCVSASYGEAEDYTVNIINGGGEPGPCEWTVHVWDDSWFGDEIEWELRDADDVVLLSGSDYGLGYDDIQTVTAEGPLTFWITNDGTWGDNEANYEVSNENGVIITGQMPDGGATYEFTDLNCSDEAIAECSGTPEGGTATVNPDSGQSGSTANFAVTGYSTGDLGLTYDWEYSVNGGEWQSVGTGSDDVDLTVTGEHGDVFTVRYAVTCSHSGETGYSNEVIFTIDNSNCTPSFSSSSDYIDGFVLEDIENIGSGFSPGGYGDYTAMSTALEAGQDYTASLTSSSGSGTHAAAVWIDFNNDGIFDLSEKVGFTDGIGASQTVDIALTIPADAASGEHRMRVLYQWNVLGENLNPCVSASFGEGEDYTVNITGGGTEPPGEECSQGIPSFSTIPNAYNIEMSTLFRSADDFFVEDGFTFSMNQITIDTNQQGVPDNVTIYIREDNNGAPGAIVETINTVPTSSEVVGNAFGDPIHHLTFDLDTPVELVGGTYWLDPKMSAPGGETVWLAVTDAASHGAPMQRSTDNGATWIEDPDGLNSIFTVSGICTAADSCTGTPDAGTIAGPESICPNISFTLEAEDATGGVGGLTRQWQSSPAGQEDWTDIAGANSTSYTVTGGITAATDYRFVITCTNGGESDMTEVHSVALSGADECYCTPTFSSGCGSFSDYIDNFILNGENGTAINSTNTGCSPNSYDDRTDESADLYAGMAYTGTISAGTTSDYASIWIDFNSNGSFEADELVGTINNIAVSGSEFTINIPGDAELGEHRMRVMLQFGSAPTDPCVGGTWGETHDYTVNIVQTPDCEGTPEGGTVTVSPEQGNPGSAYVVSSTGYSVATGLTYQWQSNTDNTEWVDEGAATDTYANYNAVAPLEAGISVDWRLVVTCTNSGESGTSTTDTFTTVEPGCGWETPSPASGLEDGHGNLHILEVANDFVVNVGERFYVNEFSFNVLLQPGTTVDGADINFYKDSGNGPGELEDSEIFAIPSNIDYLGNEFGFDWSRVTFNLSDIVLDGNDTTETTYWIGVLIYTNSGSSYWEVTSDVNSNNMEYLLLDGEWQSSEDVFNNVMDGVMTISGECETLDAGSMNMFDFAYYPNPVRDVLNITSKSGLQSVTAYNLAGQEVLNLNGDKLNSGQIDVTTLPKGAYVFRAVLEGGQVETFKIVKK